MPMNYGYSDMLKKHNDAGPSSAVTGSPRTLTGNGSGVKGMKMKGMKKNSVSKKYGKKKMSY